MPAGPGGKLHPAVAHFPEAYQHANYALHHDAFSFCTCLLLCHAARPFHTAYTHSCGCMGHQTPILPPHTHIHTPHSLRAL